MKTYHLATCNTCQRIIKTYGHQPNLELINIKEHPITEQELDRMKELAGSYEALFNRRARKYRALGLHEKVLAEQDYRRLILEEYTFLKRPVTIVGNQIFVGNGKSQVAAATEALNQA